MHKFKKGFTLIELLVVIAIMAVIAGAVLVGLDPIDKINAANDSKAQADIGTIATALATYATSHSGLYPCKTAGGVGCPNTAGQGDGLLALVTAGDMTAIPAVASGYTALATYEAGYAVDNSTTPARIKVIAQLKAKKWAGGATGSRWIHCSWLATTGDYTVAATTATTAACP